LAVETCHHHPTAAAAGSGHVQLKPEGMVSSRQLREEKD